MKKEFEKSSTSSIFSGSPKDDVELYAAINPEDNNNVVVSWMQVTPFTLEFKLVFTTDFGKTWNDSHLNFNVKSDPIVAGGDPVIVFGKDGYIYLSWIYAYRVYEQINGERRMLVEMSMFWAYSTDKGESWTKEQDEDKYIASGRFLYTQAGITESTYSGGPADKQWMTVNPLTGDLFVSLTEFGDLSVVENLWGVRKKEFSAHSFSQRKLPPSDTTKVAIHGSLVASKTGVIHTVFPCFSDTLSPIMSIFHSASYDNGETYSEQTKIADGNAENFNAFGIPNKTDKKVYDRLYGCVYCAIDNSSGSYSGRLYVVWNANDFENNNGIDVYLSYSDDKGKTWLNKPIRVNDDTFGNGKNQHRPSIFVNGKGTVFISWFDGRSAADDKENTDFYVGVSNDGGATFTNTKLSDNAFDMQELTGPWKVGEYFQIVANDNDEIMAFWPYLTIKDGIKNVELYSNIAKSETGVISRQAINADMSILQIYPNPVKNILNIDFELDKEQELTFKILDINGECLYRSNPEKYKKGSNKFSMNFSEFEAGTYFISIHGNTGSCSGKFVK